MDFRTYCKILEAKGEDPLKIKDDVKNMDVGEFNNATLKFRCDLATSKACWVNNIWRDWGFWMRNNHPVFGMFCAPLKHPFSKSERLVVLCCVLSLSTLSTIFTTTSIDNERDRILISLGFGICISLVHNLLKVIATCGCVQESHSCVRCCLEQLGHIILGLWVIGSIIIFVIGISIAVENSLGTDFILGFVISLFVSWIFAIFSLSLSFLYYWRKDHFYNIEEEPYQICYIDYQDWIESRPFTRDIKHIPEVDIKRSMGNVLMINHPLYNQYSHQRYPTERPNEPRRNSHPVHQYPQPSAPPIYNV